MKIHFGANKVWIFAPKMIKKNNSFWREDSYFNRSNLNFHAKIAGFGATIKFGEKLRIFEHCAMVAPHNKFKRLLAWMRQSSACSRSVGNLGRFTNPYFRDNRVPAYETLPEIIKRSWPHLFRPKTRQEREKAQVSLFSQHCLPFSIQSLNFMGANKSRC